MLLAIEIFVLIFAINFTPQLLGYYLEETWGAPLDFGARLPDGKRLLGPHKTIRGFVAGVGVGALLGWLFGLGWVTGLIAGLLSMGGDAATSMVKRRLGHGSGHDLPGLDHFLEGALPLAYLAGSTRIGLVESGVLLLLFVVGGYSGSILWKKLVKRVTKESSKRPRKTRVILKEATSCGMRSKWLGRFFNFEDAVYYHLIIHSFFKAAGLYDRGMANALSFVRKNLTLTFDNLPAGFEGYTVLLLTDLHLDGLPGLTERLQTVLAREGEVDLCVLGGDYRMATHGPFSESMHQLERLVPSIRARQGIVAILGNHDCFEMAEEMGGWGVQVLINDSLALERDGQRIWLVGVDDPHYYRTHDLGLAFQGVPRDEFSILLAHSPRLYKRAVPFGPDLYLTGHTHAGQVQIPRLGPVFTHTWAPRRYCCGEWRYQGMAGYTSSGVGASGVPVRFNCPGEIVRITLRRSEGTKGG